MQPQEILKDLHDSKLVRPEFWYLYSLVITGLLVSLIIAIIVLVRGFLTSFMSEMKTTNGKFSESIQRLTTLAEIHENEQKHMREDIGELKTALSKRSR